jgi:hypothetical protein
MHAISQPPRPTEPGLVHAQHPNTIANAWPAESPGQALVRHSLKARALTGNQ